MKKQMTKIVMMLILVTGLSAGVAEAQIDVGFYTGVETSPGTCEAITSVCYGNTFVLNSSGEWETHYLTLSLDYVNVPNHNGSGMGITGGNWSLVVFRDNQYFGTLYGRVETGNIIVITDYTKDEDGSRQVQATLVSTGGFGPFTEYKKIHGELSVISDLRSGETKGTASFNF
ncbi:MAG: hypothetical protein WBD16_06755 [Pyrinomonadaceae bacterium]